MVKTVPSDNTVMDIWRHDICHVIASRWCHICQNVSPIPSNRYDEAIFVIGIIKNVTGEKRQGGGIHHPWSSEGYFTYMYYVQVIDAVLTRTNLWRRSTEESCGIFDGTR